MSSFYCCTTLISTIPLYLYRLSSGVLPSIAHGLFCYNSVHFELNVNQNNPITRLETNCQNSALNNIHGNVYTRLSRPISNLKFEKIERKLAVPFSKGGGGHACQLVNTAKSIMFYFGRHIDFGVSTKCNGLCMELVNEGSC